MTEGEPLEAASGTEHLDVIQALILLFLLLSWIHWRTAPSSRRVPRSG